jgi:hypothetical protein
MPIRVSFRVVTGTGKPLPGLQVLVRTCGRFEYALTNRAGIAQFPLAPQLDGKVIIGGRTRYLGNLSLQQLILN